MSLLGFQQKMHVGPTNYKRDALGIGKLVLHI